MMRARIDIWYETYPDNAKEVFVKTGYFQFDRGKVTFYAEDLTAKQRERVYRALEKGLLITGNVVDENGRHIYLTNGPNRCARLINYRPSELTLDVLLTALEKGELRKEERDYDVLIESQELCGTDNFNVGLTD